MDIAQVPRSFWHALSFCMVLGTVGLVYVAYRSTSVTIEIADAKINLSSTLEDVKRINAELESKNNQLQEINTKLQSQLEELKRSQHQPPSLSGESQKGPGLEEKFRALRVEPIHPKTFDELNTKLKGLESAIQKIQ